MKALEERIRREGKVLPGEILKVGSFFNQQVDVRLLMDMGVEIARAFCHAGVTKVLTVESSGIALAVAAAHALGVNAVFAKKSASANVSGELYTAEVYSYTHKKMNMISVSRDYITAEDCVLIVDDFLATGNAVNGLISIVEKAGARLAGVSAGIEKGFQGGGDALRARGIRVESLAVIDAFEADNTIRFRP